MGGDYYDRPVISTHTVKKNTSTKNTTNKINITYANTVVGNTSGTEATITAQWPGDLVPGSGKVLYIENIDPITRSAAQSETFKIIVEY